MSRIDRPGASEQAEVKKRLHQQETRSPGGNTSVTEGRLRIAGENSLLVEGSGRVSGQLYVEGLEVVSGELRVTGTFNMDGDANVSGTMDVSGPLTVQGNTTFIGPMRVEGKSDFIGMMVVQGESQFVGNMSIDGPVTIKGKTTVTGELIVQGDVTFTGATKLNGPTEITGNVAVKGNGTIRVGSIVMRPGTNGGSGGVTSDNTLYLGGVGKIDLLTNGGITMTSGDGVSVRGAGMRIENIGTVPANSTGWSPLLINNATGLIARQG